jgi:hypothetical protein
VRLPPTPTKLHRVLRHAVPGDAASSFWSTVPHGWPVPIVMVAGVLLPGGVNLKLSKALIEMSRSDAEEEPTPQERIERLRFDVSVER